jgi:hypothetical protein
MDTYLNDASGRSPLAQDDPSYFIAMCTAIGTGIATGSPTISFTTSDSGFKGGPPPLAVPPSIPGTGSGVGITVDDSFFKEKIYTVLRNNIISEFGETSHDPYPPSGSNSGKFLLAIAKAVSESVKEHFLTAWTLTSSHPMIYSGTGTIGNGNFSGLVPNAVSSAMQSAAPTLQGPFWPKVCQGIAQAYVDTIHTKSTGTVTIIGVCVPNASLVCNIPGTGSGSGAAS